MLRQNNSGLSLVIIGDERYVPKKLRRSESVVLKGTLKRSEVLGTLKSSRYYISTTRIENSSNAASEGAVFAEESFISDIGPHRELLGNARFDQVRVAGVNRPLLHVVGANMSSASLKPWGDVICEMINRVNRIG